MEFLIRDGEGNPVQRLEIDPRREQPISLIHVDKNGENKFPNWIPSRSPDLGVAYRFERDGKKINLILTVKPGSNPLQLNFYTLKNAPDPETDAKPSPQLNPTLLRDNVNRVRLSLLQNKLRQIEQDFVRIAETNPGAAAELPRARHRFNLLYTVGARLIEQKPHAFARYYQLVSENLLVKDALPLNSALAGDIESLIEKFEIDALLSAAKNFEELYATLTAMGNKIIGKKKARDWIPVIQSVLHGYGHHHDMPTLQSITNNERLRDKVENLTAEIQKMSEVIPTQRPDLFEGMPNTLGILFKILNPKQSLTLLTQFPSHGYVPIYTDFLINLTTPRNYPYSSVGKWLIEGKIVAVNTTHGQYFICAPGVDPKALVAAPISDEIPFASVSSVYLEENPEQAWPQDEGVLIQASIHSLIYGGYQAVLVSRQVGMRAYHEKLITFVYAYRFNNYQFRVQAINTSNMTFAELQQKLAPVKISLWSRIILRVKTALHMKGPNKSSSGQGILYRPSWASHGDWKQASWDFGIGPAWEEAAIIAVALLTGQPRVYSLLKILFIPGHYRWGPRNDFANVFAAAAISGLTFLAMGWFTGWSFNLSALNLQQKIIAGLFSYAIHSSGNLLFPRIYYLSRLYRLQKRIDAKKQEFDRFAATDRGALEDRQRAFDRFDIVGINAVSFLENRPDLFPAYYAFASKLFRADAMTVNAALAGEMRRRLIALNHSLELLSIFEDRDAGNENISSTLDWLRKTSAKWKKPTDAFYFGPFPVLVKNTKKRYEFIEAARLLSNYSRGSELQFKFKNIEDIEVMTNETGMNPTAQATAREFKAMQIREGLSVLELVHTIPHELTHYESFLDHEAWEIRADEMNRELTIPNIHPWSNSDSLFRLLDELDAYANGTEVQLGVIRNEYEHAMHMVDTTNVYELADNAIQAETAIYILELRNRVALLHPAARRRLDEFKKHWDRLRPLIIETIKKADPPSNFSLAKLNDVESALALTHQWTQSKLTALADAGTQWQISQHDTAEQGRLLTNLERIGTTTTSRNVRKMIFHRFIPETEKIRPYIDSQNPGVRDSHDLSDSANLLLAKNIGGLIMAIDSGNNENVLAALDKFPVELSLQLDKFGKTAADPNAAGNSLAAFLRNRSALATIKNQIGNVPLQWNEEQKHMLALTLTALGSKDPRIAKDFTALLFDESRIPVFILSGKESKPELACLSAFLDARSDALVYLREEDTETFNHVAAHLGTHRLTGYSSDNPNTFDGNKLPPTSFIVKPDNITVMGGNPKTLVFRLEDIFPILKASIEMELRSAVKALIAA